MFSKTTSKQPGYCAAFCSTHFEQEIAVRQLATQVLKSSFQSKHHQLLWFHKSAMAPDKLHSIRSVNKTRLLTELAILKAPRYCYFMKTVLNEQGGEVSMHLTADMVSYGLKLYWRLSKARRPSILNKKLRDSCVDFQNKSNAKRPCGIR